MQHDLNEVVSDSRRRQLDIFRERQFESDVELPSSGPFEAGALN